MKRPCWLPAIGYAREGFSADGADRLLLGSERAHPFEVGGLPRAPSCPDGRAPAQGRDLPQPGTLADTLREARAGAAATPSTRARSRARSTPSCRRNGRVPVVRGPRGAPLGVGRAGLHELPRLRRLGAAAQRPGDRRAADPQHPRGLRPRRRWASAARTTSTTSSRPRSWPSRIGRASTPTRTSTTSRWRLADLQGVRGRAPQADRSRARRAQRYRSGQSGSRRSGDTIYLTTR